MEGEVSSHAFGQVQAVAVGWEKRSQKGGMPKQVKEKAKYIQIPIGYFFKTLVLGTVKYLLSNY